MEFDPRERTVYKNFSNSLFSSLSKIESNAKYYDIDAVQIRLEDCFKKVMLEDTIPKTTC